MDGLSALKIIGGNSMVVNPSVLIGCPICQKPLILKEFLHSLKNINIEGLKIDFLFIDDNIVEESTNLLKSFFMDGSKINIIKSKYKDNYICTEKTHLWDNDLIWKVADFKNTIINHAKNTNYDYLFLIDSDIMLHPITIQHLIKQEKDIISEIFWTKWLPETMELPQVWLYDKYTLYEPESNVNLTNYEINLRTMEFINKLRVPGIYKVGGLGACTLISKKAVNSGISFSRIPNISFWGEDRHFCIRALVLSLELYVDTNYPAYHIYRDSQLDGVDEFKNKCEYKHL